jgi:hypothetical protein
MSLSNVATGALAIALLAPTSVQAGAMEIVGGPDGAVLMSGDAVAAAYVHRGPAGRAQVHRHPGVQPSVHPGHRPGVHVGYRPGAHPGYHPGVHPGAHPGYHPGVHASRRPAVHAGVHPASPPGVQPAFRPVYHAPVAAGPWTRPGWYRWAPGGAVAAGVAIGFASAAAVPASAPPPPQPGLCWYYKDPSQRSGFWDACP